MKRRLFLVCLWLCTMAASAQAQELEAKILQVKLGRIYLAAGFETGLTRDALFTIQCGGKETTQGTIEYVGPGISYSNPIAGLDTMKVDAGCVAKVLVGAADSGAVVTIGTDLPMELFDGEHEPLFRRDSAGAHFNLIDSISVDSGRIVLHLPVGVFFADSSRLTAETLVWWFKNLQTYSRSYLVRWFFTKLMPIDSGGIEYIDAFTLALRFYLPFPNYDYALSRPEFAVYNQNNRGTGPLMEKLEKESGPLLKAYIPNRYYRGKQPSFQKLVIKRFEQNFRMTYAFEQKNIDGYIGFGLEELQAGSYSAKAQYPYVASLIAGIGGAPFSRAMFPTSLYYRFDPSKAHLFFPSSAVTETDRWLIRSSAPDDNKRYYPYDPAKGKALEGSIGKEIKNISLAYDHPLLYETARYLADMAAREEISSSVDQYTIGANFDLRLAFLPASDSALPFALLAAVLEMNDQNAYLPADKRLDRPGWDDADRGTRYTDPQKRNYFYSLAEEVLFQTGGFFPLFRPNIFAVTGDRLRGLQFDYYGFPELDRIVKFGPAEKKTANVRGTK